ncbi:hypothetical protein [Actinomadura spongiicola]|nr:hypothetical protein [Actinomadura spongiicola]
MASEWGFRGSITVTLVLLVVALIVLLPPRAWRADTFGRLCR